MVFFLFTLPPFGQWVSLGVRQVSPSDMRPQTVTVGSVAFCFICCHYVKFYRSHSPLCFLFNLHTDIQINIKNRLDIIYRIHLKSIALVKLKQTEKTLHCIHSMPPVFHAWSENQVRAKTGMLPPTVQRQPH